MLEEVESHEGSDQKVPEEHKEEEEEEEDIRERIEMPRGIPNKSDEPRLHKIQGRWVSRRAEFPFRYRRRNMPPWRDVPRTGGLYWYITQLHWPYLVVLAAAYVIVVTLIFAAFYYIDNGPSGIQNSAPGSFSDAFWLSQQTMSTLGYGRLNPVSTYTNIISFIQTFVSLMTYTVIAATIYLRVLSPTQLSHSIIFSSKAVINSTEFYYDPTLDDYVSGEPCLAFRFIHSRRGQLNLPVLRVFLRYAVPSPYEPDEWIDTFEEINFEIARQRGPIRIGRFPFTLFVREFLVTVLNGPWLVVHRLSRSSPLSSLDLSDHYFEIIPVFEATDDLTGLSFQKYWSYTFEDLVWNHRFARMVTYQEKRSLFDINFGLLSDIVPTRADVIPLVRRGRAVPRHPSLVEFIPLRGPSFEELGGGRGRAQGDEEAPGAKKKKPSLKARFSKFYRNFIDDLKALLPTKDD